MSRDSGAASVATSRPAVRGAAAVIGVVAASLAALLAWTASIELDVLVQAPGRVVPESRVRPIQSEERGRIAQLLVEEGSRVEAGDLLVVLENPEQLADRDQTRARLLGLAAASIRLAAERDGTPPTFPAAADPQLLQRLFGGAAQDGDAEVWNAAVQLEREAYDARQERQRSRRAALEAELRARRARLVENQTSLRGAAAQLAHAEAEERRIAEGVAQGWANAAQLSPARDRALGLRREVEGLRAAEPRIQAEIEERQRSIQALEAERRDEAAQQLTQTERDIAALRDRAPATSARAGRSLLRAPVTGEVKRLAPIAGIGGVVEPGTVVLELVPLESAVMIEAEVPPARVAGVHAGQEAWIRITAYPAARYPAVRGQVELVSPDAVEDPRGPPTFRLRVRADAAVLQPYGGGPAGPITPGMQAAVDVLVRRESALSWFLEPFLINAALAFRER